MTGMEDKFKRRFYEKLKEILGNPGLISEARRRFQHGTDLRRYNCKESFGLKNWDEEEAIAFSSAVSEALTFASEQYMKECNDNFDAAKQYKIAEAIKKEIPTLTAQISLAGEPLEKIIPLIDQQLETLRQEQGYIANNPYAFYSGAAATVMLAAAAITIAMKS
ncbi:hypothetical protein [Legionella spiritensis]|uniref:Uncharacterized protein n=1 Tax=Legionella spiritensis TaxID=452 RepID=A0A0W0ZAG2_LEGSP|nr:hypothetical protein [Legionella spiritensis]KTD66097.1 hypothetical protein Lspi_0160 [Legionella spiritensis]SNV44203.1 Uncharacterised protein [Legionella spiritensis]